MKRMGSSLDCLTWGNLDEQFLKTMAGGETWVSYLFIDNAMTYATYNK